MPALRSNLLKRIQRLPKPSNVAGALQPLFEAVSNSIHSVQERFDDQVTKLGTINVVVNTNRSKEDISAVVTDNGLGLNQKNWEAFLTTDTDNKIRFGGKGVGRLLWLDCFNSIRITSVFNDDGGLQRRSFDFALDPDEQIINEITSPAPEETSTSFQVSFAQVRDNGYLQNFPGRDQFIFRHITSHFLPYFIDGNCPTISVRVGDEVQIFPKDIDNIIFRREVGVELNSDEFGKLTLTLMDCDKVASSDMNGAHFIHFIAHDRTVHSQNIDRKLGLKYYGEAADKVFHAIVVGEFLDNNVNQERTAFTFSDATLDKITNDVFSPHIENFLSEPLADLSDQQRKHIEEITETYPSVAFGDVKELQDKVPSGETKADAIYGHLARERFRRDQRQAEKIKGVLQRLKSGDINPGTFAQAITEAGAAIGEAERRSLTEYIVRRKVVLDFVEILLQKVRNDARDSSYQREDLLHSFICPLQVNTLEDGSLKVAPAASHDLWIIDERLTFARYFSSDEKFTTLSKAVESDERADVLIFDYAHGLRQSDEPGKVLLIEFKRPGRTDYSDRDNPHMQVERYIKILQKGGLTDVYGRPIIVDERTVFYCFIVADIVGRLDEWTFSWQRTADGRGRVYRPTGGFRGTIELMGWDALLEDARARNKAFFEHAGISGRSYFSVT